MTNCKIITGDARDVMASMDGESVQTVITSPPYFGLRDYGDDGQMGLEATPEEYVANMVEVFREARRVLRDDGTLWLNLGDSYVATGGVCKNGSQGSTSIVGHTSPESCPQTGRADKRKRLRNHGLKPKDLCGIPWRVAFALQADGWWLRQDIIWHKPNPMPESVTDRCTKAHEYIFLLTKSQRYYYDAEAIKDKATCDRIRGPALHPDAISTNGNSGLSARPSDGGRNKRSVWTVTTKPYPSAHFAVFPPDLIEPCVKAGTSERGCCPKCGKCWERVVEKESSWDARRDAGAIRGNVAFGGNKGAGTQRSVHGNHVSHDLGGSSTTTGWRPTCACKAGEPVPCTVLDPFSGSGTTGEVALQWGRKYIGIELNKTYVKLSERRIAHSMRPATNRDMDNHEGLLFGGDMKSL